MNWKITKSQTRAAAKYLKEFRSYESDGPNLAEDGIPFYQLYTISKLDNAGNLVYSIYRFDNADGEGIRDYKEVETLAMFLIDRRGQDISWKLGW